MAGSSFFALLDDIATLLDDVALMTKTAATKTAGVLGDDLALNARQVSGVEVNRELPVVWAVAKGSLRNKLILVPAALLISAIAPWAIVPLLMVGGAFLCFEGFEKILHAWSHRGRPQARHLERKQMLQDRSVDIVAFEREKVKGAIRTDFILSAEIVVIALGTVASATFGQRVAVLAGVAVIMTAGVYGAVAAIVKLDDAGLYLSARRWPGASTVGRALVAAAPYMMKGLSVLGTIAMFTVGGSIVAHGVGAVGHRIEAWTDAVGSQAWAHALLRVPLYALFGVMLGALVTGLVEAVRRLRGH